MIAGYYQKHIFFCVNQRLNNKPCCQDAAASELCDYAKQAVKMDRLASKGRIRVNKAACLGRCALGPVLVIYPEGIWYTYQTQTDIDEILLEHVLHGRLVKRLLLDQS